MKMVFSDKNRAPENKIMDFSENLFEKLAKLCEIVYNRLVWGVPADIPGSPSNMLISI